MKRYFYQGNKIVSIDGEQPQRFFRRDSLPLAQLKLTDATLLSAGPSDSIYSSNGLGEGRADFSYSPYGWCRADQSAGRNLRFNGELPDWATGLYLLGNGHRGFSPALMRFISPDRLSPFRSGGINCYAYCSDEPVGNVDPSGSVPKTVFQPQSLKKQAMSAIPMKSLEKYVQSPDTFRADTGIEFSSLSIRPIPGIEEASRSHVTRAVFNLISEHLGNVDGFTFDSTRRFYVRKGIKDLYFEQLSDIRYSGHRFIYRSFGISSEPRGMASSEISAYQDMLNDASSRSAGEAVALAKTLAEKKYAQYLDGMYAAEQIRKGGLIWSPYF